MQIDATYSPEDNKLRLYTSQRLPADLYARVKAAGYSWAPKQELFVAPMWTPERAELAEELAGEIGDEGTSREERAEERAGRFDEYSEKRAEDSRRASEAVRQLADGIPLGQPILVGHHSERHARRDAKRIENGMRKAVKMWETAEYWQERAAGALADAKYKERPDVRARRIKRLEADLRKVTKNRDSQARIVKAWERVDEPGFLKLKSGEESTHAQRVAYLVRVTDRHYEFSLAEFPRPEGASVYEGARSISDALQDGTCSTDWARDYCSASAREKLARMSAWFDHYTFRLAYERTMMGECGGTAADKSGPEKGGAVQCWAAPRGGWAYIQKVNKVSVTVLDNWGNGGGNFTRTIPFDKLTAVMSAAEVEQARSAGTLCECTDRTGFILAAPKPDSEPKTEPAPTDRPPDIEAMRASLKAGVQVIAAELLYVTPRDLAQRMAELADLQPGHRVLEPSAGTGRLVLAALEAQPDAEVTAVESNAALWNALPGICQGVPVLPGDFLEKERFELGAPFDRVIMNPPFNGGADIKHILHARSMLKPGGYIVGICAGGPRQAEKLEPLCDLWEPLPAGTFTEAGTGVNTVLFTMYGGN